MRLPHRAARIEEGLDPLLHIEIELAARREQPREIVDRCIGCRGGLEREMALDHAAAQGERTIGARVGRRRRGVGGCSEDRAARSGDLPEPVRHRNGLALRLGQQQLSRIAAPLQRFGRRRAAGCGRRKNLLQAIDDVKNVAERSAVRRAYEIPERLVVSRDALQGRRRWRGCWLRLVGRGRAGGRQQLEFPIHRHEQVAHRRLRRGQHVEGRGSSSPAPRRAAGRDRPEGRPSAVRGRWHRGTARIPRARPGPAHRWGPARRGPGPSSRSRPRGSRRADRVAGSRESRWRCRDPGRPGSAVYARRG